MKLLYRIRRCWAATLLLPCALSLIIAASALSQTEDVAETLRLNQEKWAAQQIKDYQFTFRRICFCPLPAIRPVLITVRDGQVVAVRYADSDQQPVAPEEFHRYPTVDGLFAMIQQAVTQKAYRITATYHPRRGFPTSVFIDYSAQIADEEQGFRVAVLKVSK